MLLQVEASSVMTMMRGPCHDFASPRLCMAINVNLPNRHDATGSVITGTKPVDRQTDRQTDRHTHTHTYTHTHTRSLMSVGAQPHLVLRAQTQAIMSVGALVRPTGPRLRKHFFLLSFLCGLCSGLLSSKTVTCTTTFNFDIIPLPTTFPYYPAAAIQSS